LLKRLASGPSRESLIGDLTEQYQLKRSAVWYWRQTLTAILVGTARDVRAHKWLAIRAVVTGWMILIPLVFLAGALYDAAANWASTWTQESVTLGRIWWFYRAPLLIMWRVGSATTGWIIARMNRGHRAAMLFICAASQLPWVVLWNWPIWRLAHSGLPFFRSFPVLFNVMVMFIGMPISILLGGLLASDRERQSDPSPDVSLSTP
jgi:hypothetical protein